MHEIGWQARLRRTRWIGVTALTALAAVIVIAVFSGRSRGPEATARQFLEVLLEAPEDTTRLRALAHSEQTDDPQALIEGLATRVALDFLRARARQGAVYEVEVAESRKPTPQLYEVVLRVAENADGRTPALRRRFQVSLRGIESGDWRISAVAALSE